MTNAGPPRLAHTPTGTLLDEASVQSPAIGLSISGPLRPDAAARRLPLVPLVALASVALLDSLVSVVYLPALPAIARSYHASPALLGWTVSVPALVGAATYPLGGRFATCTAGDGCSSASLPCSPRARPAWPPSTRMRRY
jgi:hypothetical protein